MPDMPRIVLDGLLVRPQLTGVGRSIIELTRALAAERRGFAFTVLASHPEAFTHLRERPEWRVVNCPGARGGTLRKALYSQWRLPTILARSEASLLHSLQFVAPLRCPCPSVVTVHDLAYLRFPETVEWPRRSYYNCFVPRTLERAAAVVTNSAATAAEVAEYFPSVALRVQVTPFGTPSWILDRLAEDPPSREPRNDGPFVFVGTLEPRKNVVRLLQAYALLLSRYSAEDRLASLPDLLLVGGKGWNDGELRSLSAGLRQSGKLREIGHCEADQLIQVYRSARALLFPSLHEGFGFPILEAMAAGLPVLTANRGAMAEVAGEAALLVDPVDVEAIALGMERIVTAADLRSELVSRGFLRSRQWTWESTATATLQVYEQVLRQSRGGQGGDN